MRWNSPDQWIISRRATHPALITEAEFIAVQETRARRADARHVYLLTGLLRCAMCVRTMRAAATDGNPAYRGRHGHTSAAVRGSPGSKNACARLRPRDPDTRGPRRPGCARQCVTTVESLALPIRKETSEPSCRDEWLAHTGGGI
jgi:hypothetical protein